MRVTQVEFPSYVQAQLSGAMLVDLGLTLTICSECDFSSVSQGTPRLTACDRRFSYKSH